VTRDSILNITVTQRKPVVRFQKKDGGFYADAEGYIFPLQSSYASHVQIIDGEIPLAANSGYKGDIEDPKEKAWFKSVMNVVNFIEGSKTWKGKIVQISVDEKGELILVPREGNEKFLFGQPNSLAEKFGKMEKYYTTIVPAKGGNKYKTVDVRFDRQIVCK
jgi:cell division protein FtsQ